MTERSHQLTRRRFVQQTAIGLSAAGGPAAILAADGATQGPDL
jgi:hypothetical protein